MMRATHARRTNWNFGVGRRDEWAERRIWGAVKLLRMTLWQGVRGTRRLSKLAACAAPSETLGIGPSFVTNVPRECKVLLAGQCVLREGHVGTLSLHRALSFL